MTWTAGPAVHVQGHDDDNGHDDDDSHDDGDDDDNDGNDDKQERIVCVPSNRLPIVGI